MVGKESLETPPGRKVQEIHIFSCSSLLPTSSLKFAFVLCENSLLLQIGILNDKSQFFFQGEESSPFSVARKFFILSRGGPGPSGQMIIHFLQQNLSF